MVKQGFEWELRLVGDSGRGNGDLDSTSSAKEVQDACSAGTFVDQGDADLNLDIAYTWDGTISAYTGYLLCLKYANTAGTSEWAVPASNAEIQTPPAAPPGPRYEASRSSTSSDGNTRTLVWSVPNRNSENVPREMGDFAATIITYPVRYDHDSGTSTTNSLVGTPAPTSCEPDDITDGPSNWDSNGTNPWDTSTTATITNDLDGLTVTSAAITIPENTGENLGVRLCVRATKDSAGGTQNGPWVLGGGATIAKKPAS